MNHSIQDSAIREFEGKISTWARNCPIWCGKLLKKQTFHDIGDIFHFLRAEFLFWSAEFPFSERRILGSLFRETAVFEGKNLHFLSAECLFLNTKFWFLEFWNLYFLSTEFAFSERRILEVVMNVSLQSYYQYITGFSLQIELSAH